MQAEDQSKASTLSRAAALLSLLLSALLGDLAVPGAAESRTAEAARAAFVGAGAAAAERIFPADNDFPEALGAGPDGPEVATVAAVLVPSIGAAASLYAFAVQPAVAISIARGFCARAPPLA